MEILNYIMYCSGEEFYKNKKNYNYPVVILTYKIIKVLFFYDNFLIQSYCL